MIQRAEVYQRLDIPTYNTDRSEADITVEIRVFYPANLGYEAAVAGAIVDTAHAAVQQLLSLGCQ
jgi:hypothetical protein